MSVSLASLEARVGPYSFPAENWSSLSGHKQSSVALPLRSQMLIALGKQSSFRCLVWEGRSNIQSACLIEMNKHAFYVLLK